MQAIKKIEEHTNALVLTSALLDEWEAMGPALADNPEKKAILLAEFQLVRDRLTEVTSLASHLMSNNDVSMASLHFQQASAPLLSRFAALSDKIGPIPSVQVVSSPRGPSDRPSVPVPVDKTSKKVSLSGWLRKKGKSALSNAHRRYFLLDQSAPTQLRYYETDTLAKQKGFIPLDHMEAVLVNDIDKTMFGINTGTRVWELQADTEHDARIWVKALSKWGEQFHILQSRLKIAPSEAKESRNVDHSPRKLDSASTSSSVQDTAPNVDEELVKIQQEAEKRELMRQQESARRWKEKQELRFHREAARLKEEATSRYLTSSESQDLSSQSKSPRSSTSSQTAKEGATSPAQLSSPVSSSTHSDSGSPDSSSTSATTQDSSTATTDPAELKEKLKAALKLKRERTLVLSDLLHQRQLFLSLKAEKVSEIKKVEDADATVTSMRETRDELKFAAEHLATSIATYQQQLLQQDKLIGLLQSSAKQNEVRANELHEQLSEARNELDELEPAFTTLNLSLSSLAVSRMIAHSGMKTRVEVEDKIEMMREAIKAHEELATLTRHAMEKKEDMLANSIVNHKQEMLDLQEQLDATRHEYQFLRTLLHTEAGYSIQEELEELKHDYFVTIVNGIKLNMIQEGYVMKVTSPTNLFQLARQENVPQSEWPNWASSYIHSKCVESLPKKLQRAADDGDGDDGDEEGDNRGSIVHDFMDPHLHSRQQVSKSRRRQLNFGSSIGANFGGGGLMMM